MSEYRLKAGTVTAANIEADNAALVENFPRQSDQPNQINWYISAPGTIQDYAERITKLNSFESAFGRPNTTMTFSLLTPGMLAYLFDTFYANGAVSAAVTVKIRDRRLNSTNDYVVYNCLMHKPGRDELLPTFLNARAYLNVPFRLTRMTIATDGGGFSSGFSQGFN